MGVVSGDEGGAAVCDCALRAVLCHGNADGERGRPGVHGTDSSADCVSLYFAYFFMWKIFFIYPIYTPKEKL